MAKRGVGKPKTPPTPAPTPACHQALLAPSEREIRLRLIEAAAGTSAMKMATDEQVAAEIAKSIAGVWYTFVMGNSATGKPEGPDEKAADIFK